MDDQRPTVCTTISTSCGGITSLGRAAQTLPSPTSTVYCRNSMTQFDDPYPKIPKLDSERAFELTSVSHRVRLLSVG